jgi:Fic family protein
MSILADTPYVLDEAHGQRVVASVQRLAEQVSLLRRQGALDPATLARLRQEWGFKQVHESAAIEGNSLSLGETITAIQRGMTISGKPPEDSREVQNLYEAIRFVESLASTQAAVSEREICELQSLIVGRDAAESGRYRSIEVSITNSPHKPPHPIKVSDYMRDLAAWLTTADDVPPILLSAVSHAWLVHIHPFRDGNGRTARAVGNLQLIRAGYPIVVIRHKDRQRYYEALRASDIGDITPFLELVTDRCNDSLHQIDRVRSAVTGVSLAVEKVLEADRRRYQIWSAGIQLLAKTVASTFKDLEDRIGCRIDLQSYDMPTEEDYRALTERNADGNTWLEKITVRRGAITRSVLFWIGYSSDELREAMGLSQTIPAVKISVPNSAPPPAWVAVGPDFPTTAREFAYHDGRYWRLDYQVDRGTVKPIDNVQVLASEFAADLLQGWFAN